MKEKLRFILLQLGLCNVDKSKGIFRRKLSNTSAKSHLHLPNEGVQSCPTSPRRTQNKTNKSHQSIDESEELEGPDMIPSCLTRSASTISSIRPRSSPAGLYSYTSSAPSSVHGSRLDLSLTDKGSAIYLGCLPPKTGITGSSWSVTSSRGGSTTSGSAPQTPLNTPPVSPKHRGRRSNSTLRKK